jgi:hypothetical protein
LYIYHYLTERPGEVNSAQDAAPGRRPGKIQGTRSLFLRKGS